MVEHVKIAGITESWASADINDTELQIDNFDVYRKDKLTMTSFIAVIGFYPLDRSFRDL